MKFNSAFWRWFKDSKIVDKKGDPLVVYHGTPSSSEHHNNKYVRAEGTGKYWVPFTKFNTSVGGQSDSGWLGRGAYFTPDPEYAYEFGDRIMPVYLSIQNPFIVDDDNSNGWEPYYGFKLSLEGLKGVPDELKINDKLPAPKNVENYRGEKYKLYYETDHVKSKGVWYVVMKSSLFPNGGSVEGTGRTEREAIDNFNEIQKHFMLPSQNPHGFILHVISKVIGSDKFTKILKDSGFDGVISSRGDEIVAFYPTQIKSEMGNDGTWDVDDEDIRSNPRRRRR